MFVENIRSGSNYFIFKTIWHTEDSLEFIS